jgi:environmental stress-induced protein Ves
MLKRQGFDDAEIKERAEKQTSNFVIFPGNERLIAILKKYGLPISAAGLAALSQLHPQEAQAAQQKPLRIELNAGERDRMMKKKGKR